MGDDDVLLTRHLAKLQAARLAIVAAIERMMGDNRPQAVQFAVVALSELFADIFSISAGVPKSPMQSITGSRRAAGGWSRSCAIEPARH
jgi:hypothetical protein